MHSCSGHTHTHIHTHTHSHIHTHTHIGANTTPQTTDAMHGYYYSATHDVATCKYTRTVPSFHPRDVTVVSQVIQMKEFHLATNLIKKEKSTVSPTIYCALYKL